MKTYKIQMNVEIVPCTESPTDEPIGRDDGSFEITIAESDAINIDTCERALLQTAYPTLREALSAHFSEMSKKKALEHMTAGDMVTKRRPYQVDGEIGRFTFMTHQILYKGDTLYDTAHEVFPMRKCWEWYKTSGFKEVAYIYGATEESYRKTSRLINRIRYQAEDGTPSRTLREQAEGEGKTLMQAIEHKAEQILMTHDFRKTGEFDGVPETYQGHRPVTLPDEQVTKAIAMCQARIKENWDLSTNPVCYEAPESTVNISIDDVGVKRQKAERACHAQATDEPAMEQQGTGLLTERRAEQQPEKRKRKYAHTTVVHLEKDRQSYLLTGHGIKYVLSLLIAVLLNSELLQYRLQFFTDGYTILHDAIRWCFSWYSNLAIILDWYHLEEKCKLQLSVALKGREIRNEVLTELLPFLWYGQVDQAIAFVKTVDASQIKTSEAITTLVGYFERNRPHIPCYAVRKELGLRNSSNIGEKMNDLLVSDRQKHNGMSWSVSGSVALASLTALARNNEFAQWFEEGTLEFRLAA